MISNSDQDRLATRDGEDHVGVGHATNEGTGPGTSVAADALADQAYQRDLGNGLLLRWSTPEDIEQLVAMFSHVFRSKEDVPPNRFHGCLVRDMMSGRHPYLTGYDFAVVEDTKTEQIVASTCLSANRVTYEHIPLVLGRAAIVGTEIAYRDRGLQRAIFGLIHARSSVRGHLVQGITGINYFYRQFGYEHAIDLEATRHVYFAALPSFKATESIPFTLRPAVETDIPLLIDLAASQRACWQIATVLDEPAWRWIVFTPNRALGNSGTVYMITTAEGATIGYLLLDRKGEEGFAGDSIGIWGMAVKQGISLVEVAPYALCAVRDLVGTFLAQRVHPGLSAFGWKWVLGMRSSMRSVPTWHP